MELFDDGDGVFWIFIVYQSISDPIYHLSVDEYIAIAKEKHGYNMEQVRVTLCVCVCVHMCIWAQI